MPAEMNKAKLLRVGIDDAPPVPMQDGDPAQGTFRGYEVDLLQLIADRLDLVLEYHRAQWSAITQQLSSGRLDLICSAATITEQRKQDVDFCAPHLRLRLALVVRDTASDPFDAVKSRFGVRFGTTAETFLRGHLGREPARVSESNQELYRALSDAQLDGVIDDSPIAMHFATALPGLRYQGAYDDTDGEYAMVVAKGNEALRQQINAALSALETDGTLSRLRQRWFGSSALLIA